MFGFLFGVTSGDSKSSLRRNLESVFLALFLAFFVRAFIVQPFKIPSSSMKPTLLVGDYILVNKFVYGIRIPFTDVFVHKGANVRGGDVVVFKKEGSNGTKKTYFIKRVVATGEDVVDIRGRGVFVNGVEISQTYAGLYGEGDNAEFERYVQRFGRKKVNVLYEKGRYSTYKGGLSYPLIIPAGHLFMMGDNRDNSQDSRRWGFVPEENVVGKAVAIHWSWSFRNSFIPQVKWERIFSGID